MPFRVSGKNIDIGEALRERVSARIVEALGKYFDGGYSGHVTVEKEGFGFRTECAIHLDSGITLHTEANGRRRLCERRSGGDADREAAAALQAAAQGRQPAARRRRGERRCRHPAPSYVIAAPEHESDDEVTEFNPVIIAGIDHRLEAALGQRGGDGTRHDRRAGRGVSSRRPWPGQPGLSPCRRQYRLDRSARHERPRRPLTASAGPSYDPPPFAPGPSAPPTSGPRSHAAHRSRRAERGHSGAQGQRQEAGDPGARGARRRSSPGRTSARSSRS